MRGSKAVLTLLEKEGVEVMFGYPGGSTLTLYDDILTSNIRHVLVRHEQCAAHMADGYARATGKIGVCTSTSGPGSTNLVTGVATAYVDSSPMLVLTGQVTTSAIGNQAFQEADSFSLMMPITKHNFRILTPSEIPEAIKRGVAIANEGRKGPVHIDLPSDVQKGEVPDQEMTKEFPDSPPLEDFADLPEALKILKSAERPLLLVGGGIIWSNASGEVVRLAEMLMAPVATTIMAKGVIPEEHPLSLGIIGMHGREVARKAFLEADVILAVGTRFSDRSSGAQSELPISTKIIHVDIDPGEAGKSARTQVRMVGDAKKALQLIIKGLNTSKGETAWTLRIKELLDNCNCNINIESTPILPQFAIHELNRSLPHDAIVCTEVGQNQMWAAHFFKARYPRQFITSGGFGTMGFGFPASLGAKVAFPDRAVIDIAGDGSIQMVSHEFATAVSENLPVVVCVFNNGWLGMVKQWQKLFAERRYSGTELKNNPDFVKLAQAYGADGAHVERPSELKEALRTGLQAGVPYLIDIHMDPEEDVLPMIPPGGKADSVIRGRCRWK
ncbi:MAG: biosynthetic-type acetolactate synthase large subunit [Methanomassiliicoccus sp.]|nr:biosynthetic-type acetolactate synthase large subunit [Methanomassiliicoccus sp.]